MKTVINSFKSRISFSNFWIRVGFIIVIVAIVANHLIDAKNFPFHKDYKFPLFPIGVSIVSGFVLILIARLNFRYFESKYFIKKINVETVLGFLFSTLGYTALLYIALYYGLNGVINGTDSYSTYRLVSGLSVNLLMNTVVIALLFSTAIYKLHKLTSIKGILKVQQGGKITLVKYTEIAFIYSENKIVYIVKADARRIITDFTLNEVESRISEQGFFRANRQIVLHYRSIEQIQSIENGKLSVLLKPTISDQKRFQITISRYKKQSFMDWFDGKS